MTYRWVDHTGELELALEGKSEEEVFLAGLAALQEVLVEDANGPLERREIKLAARDRETLLADWLSELVFLADAEGFAPEHVAALALADERLRAIVEGRRGRTQNLVKAVTYHRLAFKDDDGAWQARVVLDV
ncbi:MAG: archease [Actinomycetota bacterium]|nr:archease [Actinomycetota bacterium]